MMQPSVLGQVSPATAGQTSTAHSSSSGSSSRAYRSPPSTTANTNAARRMSSNTTGGYTRVDAGGPSRNMADNVRAESWVEVSSQPSDSYTSSSSSMENIAITEGLRAQNQARRRAARVARQRARAKEGKGKQAEMEDSSDDASAEDLDGSILNSLGSSIALSSSEGYDDEDESSSSSSSSSSEEDEEDGETTLGPSQQQHRLSVPGSQRPQYSQARTSSFSRAPPQPDHDAALRASLSTLLSCAAAARQLPKPASTGRNGNMPPGRVQMETYSLMTNEQREAMMDFVAATPADVAPPPSATAVAASTTIKESPNIGREIEPVRRQSVTSTPASKPLEAKLPEKKKTHHRRSSAKRARSSSPAVSPFPLTPANMTYVTLAVSAGAVILVSAISFSAGYALGKEVGKGEWMGLVTGGEGGQELVKRGVGSGVGRAGGRILVGSEFGMGLRGISVS